MLSYGEEREANIARNKKLLEGLDLEKLKPIVEPKETRHGRQKKAGGANKRKANVDGDSDADERPLAKAARVQANDENASPQDDASTPGSRRRSSRIAGQPTDALSRVELSRGMPHPISVKALVKDTPKRGRTRRHNPKTYGAIPGIEVGSWWASREECSNDAVHAPWVGGIAPGPDGAYSIALSGGYDDDVDEGYAFTYTGAGKFQIQNIQTSVKITHIYHCHTGGRDLKGTKAAPKNLRTGPQTSHQSFEHNHNKALKRSVETGKPLRVIRGYKVPSKYGPSEGYRYDGLYVVKKSWEETGINKGGFRVCKFALVRLPGQPPIPVKDTEDEEIDEAAPAMDDSEADAEGEDEEE